MELTEQLERFHALGIEGHVAELHTLGYTIVPPERLGADGLVERLRRLVTELATERNGGVAPDFETGATHTDLASPAGQHLFYLLGEDPAFQEAMLHEVVQAFVLALLGPNAILSSCTAMVKGPGRRPLPMHSDSPLFTPDAPIVCNATWLLTDYVKENGALCFVPGSHTKLRQPTLGENFASVAAVGGDRSAPDWGAPPGVVDEAPGAVPVVAPAGSLVVWHGNTWHGAYNRIAPGIRMNLIYYFSSPALRPQEPYRELLPQDVLDRHDDEFARLLGRDIWYGWTAEGPEYEPGAAFERHRRRALASV